MTKIIYLFALSVALFSFILGTLNRQISLFTCFVRSSVVFLGILFVFSIGGQLLKWIIKKNEEDLAIQMQQQKSEENDSEEIEKEEVKK